MEVIDKLVKEKFDGIKEINYKIDYDDLIYYFKGDTAKKINDFDNGIKLCRKIRSGEVKLEDAKEL